MVNILLENCFIGENWVFKELKKHILPNQKITIIPFSFGDEIDNYDKWADNFDVKNGKFIRLVINALDAYKINEKNISIINYYCDTKEEAKEKINDSDIIYFLGGFPDKMIKRLEEFELIDTLKSYNKTVMGFSAGALIQLNEYHISPDDDYDGFGYYKGIGYIDDFYLQVHYQNTNIQNNSINKVKIERQKPVYATEYASGTIIVDNGKITTLGNVKIY